MDHLEPSIISGWRALAERLRSLGHKVSLDTAPSISPAVLFGPWSTMHFFMDDELEEGISVVYHGRQALALLPDGSALLVEGCVL